jgi:hypothetical protein
VAVAVQLLAALVSPGRERSLKGVLGEGG